MTLKMDSVAISEVTLCKEDDSMGFEKVICVESASNVQCGCAQDLEGSRFSV